MELVQGAGNSSDLQKVLKLLQPLPIVWPSEADSSRALATFTKLHLSHAIGMLDSLIGETAVGLSADLCTFNAKHFKLIAGLNTIQPY
ncbi:MAG: hypothetical protein K2W96_17625 [Gemmataceae bacterium]|nr:hypothetical protein [Gemmataceae bacterium]